LGQNWLNFELTFPPIEQAITSLKPGIRLTKANFTVRFQFGLGLRERLTLERIYSVSSDTERDRAGANGERHSLVGERARFRRAERQARFLLG